MLRIHHMGNTLECGDDHRLLPLLQVAELSRELFLERYWGIPQYLESLVRKAGVDLSLVDRGSFTVDQATLFQAIEDIRHRCLTEADLFC